MKKLNDQEVKALSRLLWEEIKENKKLSEEEILPYKDIILRAITFFTNGKEYPILEKYCDRYALEKIVKEKAKRALEFNFPKDAVVLEIPYKGEVSFSIEGQPYTLRKDIPFITPEYLEDDIILAQLENEPFNDFYLEDLKKSIIKKYIK